jgi:hypothetical protein
MPAFNPAEPDLRLGLGQVCFTPAADGPNGPAVP